jgi:CheY-like chemotaxis protein
VTGRHHRNSISFKEFAHMAILAPLRRILVVEDEALILLDIEQTLREAGVEQVFTATGSKDALAIIEATPLDAAVLDLRLGQGGSSDEIARWLQQKDVPFVFLSGSVGVVDGFADTPLVSKPFSSDQLIAALEPLVPDSAVAAA